MKELKKARMGMIAVAVVILESVARRLMGARRRSSGMMTLVVAGMVLLVAAGGVSANGACIAADSTVFGPGSTVTKSCTFNTSMTCTDDTMPGLYIGADDIVINGNGYAMTGSRSATACGLAVFGGSSPGESVPAKHSGIVNGANMQSYDNVVIQNLEIMNFCTGIVLGDGAFSVDVDNVMVADCCIHNCGEFTKTTHGIHMVGTNNCNIINNEIFDITGTGASSGCSGGGNGIFIYGVNMDRGNHNTINGNELYDNIKSGFFMKMKCMHNTVSNNVATGNSQGGIVLRCAMSNYNTIDDNSASENSWHGIYIGGKDNIIRRNTVTNNTECGINMGRSDGSYNNEVRENTACGNGGVDISTCGLQCYGNHGDDNTCNTTSNYDDDGTTGCTFSCAPPEKSDLGITEKSETLEGSGTLEVTYTMKNNGGGDAGASTIGIYIGATQVATDSVGVLSAGASHTGAVTIDPFNCPCGMTVVVKVCADKESAVDESDETNNCMASTFNCPPCAADPQLCPIPDHNFGTVQPGQTETWQFDVTNCGGAGTLTWTVSDDRAWITVSPISGTDTGTVTVTINTAGLSDGAHTGTVTVASDHGTETETISVMVKGPPPTSEVPTFTPIGMLAMVGLLGIAGIGVIRRR